MTGRGKLNGDIISDLNSRIYELQQYCSDWAKGYEDVKQERDDLQLKLDELSANFEELSKNVKVIESEKEALQQQLNYYACGSYSYYRGAYESLKFNYGMRSVGYDSYMTGNSSYQTQFLGNPKPVSNRQLQVPEVLHSAPLATVHIPLNKKPDTFVSTFFGIVKEMDPKSGVQLDKLQCKLDAGSDTSNYFKQFVPFIKNEIKDTISKEMMSISERNKAGFVVKVMKKSTSDSVCLITCTCLKIALPQLDHGFFKEIIGIVRLKKGKKFIMIAIGKEERTVGNTVEIVITIPVAEQVNFHSGDDLTIHCLGGLIPAERMWYACTSLSRVSFECQFIYGQLCAWPLTSSTLESATSLNDSQSHVVEALATVASGLFLVQGPPGTGKSTTVVEMLYQRILANPSQKVLVCTPANKSLQDLARKVHDKFPHVHIALTGVKKDMDHSLYAIYVNDYGNQFIAILNLRIHELSNIPPDQVCETHLMDSVRDEIVEIANKIEFLLSAPSVLKPDDDVISTLENLKDSLKSMSKEPCSVKQMIAVLGEYVGSLNAAKFEKFLLQRAQVVFSTLVSSGRPELQKNVSRFHTVIVDEAAQALVPETLIPMKFKPELMVLVGDPKQLSPHVESQEAKSLGYSNSLMSWLMLDCGQESRMLTEQYRMHPDICRWPSQRNYNDKLITPNEVLSRASILDNNVNLDSKLKVPNLLIDIKGEENREEPSISNEAEARVVVDALCYLLKTCRFNPEQIGIITFYTKQVRVISNMIRQRKGVQGIGNVLVSTVDGFQGGERDITLVSAVRTCKSVGFLKDPSRINVAMTRAKYARWVFGHKSILEESEDCDFAHFVMNVEPGEVLSKEEFCNIVSK